MADGMLTPGLIKSIPKKLCFELYLWKKGQRFCVEIHFKSPNSYSKGVGYAAWFTIPKLTEGL